MNRIPFALAYEVYGKPSIALSMAGAVQSGKSTLLTALHTGLKYNKAGIPVTRGRFPGKVWGRRYGAFTEKQERGFLRPQATDTPDELSLYGLLDGNLIKIRAFAPGGHQNAQAVKSPVDGLLYLLDLAFIEYAHNLLSQENAVFPLRGGYIRIDPKVDDAGDIRNYFREHLFYGIIGLDDETDRYLHQDSLENLVVRGIPAFGLPYAIRKRNGMRLDMDRSRFHNEFEYYKTEPLADMVESVLGSHSAMESIARSGAPVFGIFTHKDVCEPLPAEKTEVLKHTEKTLNALIESYHSYLALYKETPVNLGNLQITGDGAPVQEWRIVDSTNRRKMPVIEAVHHAIQNILESKGHKSKDFRLVTFSDVGTEYTTPYQSLRIPSCDRSYGKKPIARPS